MNRKHQSFKECGQHLSTPVMVGESVVYATAGRLVKQGYEPKEYGVFLDYARWSKVLGLYPRGHKKNDPGRIKIPELDYGRGKVILVRWPDFGVIGLDRFERLVRKIIRKMNEGKEVEVGCIGAHGRTGTLLAGLLVYAEGLDASRAIQEVRRRYCKHAVETDEQEVFLHEFEYRLRGFEEEDSDQYVEVDGELIFFEDLVLQEENWIDQSIKKQHEQWMQEQVDKIEVMVDEVDIPTPVKTKKSFMHNFTNLRELGKFFRK